MCIRFITFKEATIYIIIAAVGKGQIKFYLLLSDKTTTNSEEIRVIQDLLMVFTT